MEMLSKPEVSKKNPYYLPKHRYYELKHFCMQYPIWKKAYVVLDGLSKRPDDLSLFSKTGEHSDPTERCAEAKLYYRNRMEMVEQAAREADAGLAPWLIKGVTSGLSYTTLNANESIPYCKDTYYSAYRKFFWILSKLRD